MSALVSDLTEASYEETLASGKAILIDFWAPWCGPCRALSPVLDSLADEFRDKVEFFKMNVDENTDTIKTLGIRSIPTIYLAAGGEVKSNLVGNLSRDKLKTELEALIAATAP